MGNYILLYTVSLSILALFYLIRITWVYKVRVSLSEADYHGLYQRLPTYFTMACCFWIWDASKFIDYGKSHVRVEKEVREKNSKRGRKIVKDFYANQDKGS